MTIYSLDELLSQFGTSPLFHAYTLLNCKGSEDDLPPLRWSSFFCHLSGSAWFSHEAGGMSGTSALVFPSDLLSELGSVPGSCWAVGLKMNFREIKWITQGHTGSQWDGCCPGLLMTPPTYSPSPMQLSLGYVNWDCCSVGGRDSCRWPYTSLFAQSLAPKTEANFLACLVSSASS